MNKIVVFTGAGVSAESGLSTFRDSDGLWEHYRVEEICTHDAWVNNPELCVKFYNDRRREIMKAKPNAAHIAIAELQKKIPSTRLITQNIDDLHERAGSTNVVHLHGEIMKLRSSINETSTIPIQNWEQHYGDKHPDGSLLRPYIVFFGEGVPYFPEACDIVAKSDILIVIGTGLTVYPAASLLHHAPHNAKIYVIDPGHPDINQYGDRIKFIQQKASSGVPALIKKLIKEETSL